MAYQPFTGITSVVNTVPSSVLVGASIIGSPPVSVTPNIGPVASMMADNITNPSATIVYNIPMGQNGLGNAEKVKVVTGTFNSNSTGIWAGGLVGQRDDTAPTNITEGNFGVVRISSLRSLYSELRDSAGNERGLNITSENAARVTIQNQVPDGATAFRFTTSVVSTSVTLIAASVSGQRSHITDFWVANSGASNTVVTWRDGSTSILGYTIAPTGSGSNSPGINTTLQTAPSQDLAFQVSPASSIVYVTVNGYTKA